MIIRKILIVGKVKSVILVIDEQHTVAQQIKLMKSISDGHMIYRYEAAMTSRGSRLHFLQRQVA